MARPPEMFVRPVTMTEGRRLQRIGRTAKDPVRLRRAIVVWMSAQGQAVPDIAQLLGCSPEYVRGVIHAFNESGFAALDPNGAGAGPRRSVIGCAARSAWSPGAVPATWAWRSAPGA
jgi:Homeodomain-like domain